MKVGSENTCGHEGYAKKQEWLSKAKIMAKQSKAKIKAKSKNGKKPKESFWNLPFRLYYTRHR